MTDSRTIPLIIHEISMNTIQRIDVTLWLYKKVEAGKVVLDWTA